MKGALALPAQQGQLPAINILWLVPVMIFGFALCPYLDITFHRARQMTTQYHWLYERAGPLTWRERRR